MSLALIFRILSVGRRPGNVHNVHNVHVTPTAPVSTRHLTPADVGKSLPDLAYVSLVTRPLVANTPRLATSSRNPGAWTAPAAPIGRSPCRAPVASAILGCDPAG